MFCVWHKNMNMNSGLGDYVTNTNQNQEIKTISQSIYKSMN